MREVDRTLELARKLERIDELQLEIFDRETECEELIVDINKALPTLARALNSTLTVRRER